MKSGPGGGIKHKAMKGIYQRYLFPALWRCEAAFCRPGRLLPGRRPGQATVEYLLLLAFIGGAVVIFGALFHKMIIGGVFTVAGLIIGAGKPSQ